MSSANERSSRLIMELVRAVSTAGDEEEILTSVPEAFRRAFGYERVSILLEGESGALVLRTLAGDFPPEVRPGLVIDPGDGLVGRAFREGGVVHAPDTAREADFREVAGVETRSELVAPIRVEGESVGVIDVQAARPGAFGAEDAELVETVAVLLGVALGRERLIAGLRSQKAQAESSLSRIREVEETKDRFISAVSHEFRTPLTSIRSFAEILLTHDQEDPETTREFISIIHDESVRLTRLVNDLLDLSKMQAGRMEWDFRENDLAEAVRRATKSVTSLAAQKDLSVEVAPGDPVPPFVFDRDKVIQVLVNLLSNAFKFSPEGRTVTILAVPHEGGARVTVRDRGPGIPPEHRERVFERFGRVGTGARKVPGTGLGLSISLEIVEAHGGRIWVEEAPGGGSDFTFLLPAAPPAGAARLAPRPKRDGKAPALAQEGNGTGGPSPPRDLRILVVDDDRNFRRFLLFELRQAGVRAIEAEDAATAIHLARTESPDLILLDMRMPGLSGRDVLTLLASDPATARIPVLVLSVAPEEESRGLPGVRNVLRKPVDREELLRRVIELGKAATSA